MFADKFLVWRYVEAVHLVSGDVAMHPLDRGAEIAEDATGPLRDCLKLGELILADDAANIRAGERVVRFALMEMGMYVILFLTTEIYLSY